MIRLLYIANMRVPTEKAHGLQIMQNCEALADNGAEVRLWAARRVNTPEMQQIRDVWAYYGVARNFTLRLLPCLDLQWLAGESRLLQRATFFLQAFTFVLVAFLGAIFSRADVYYSRDLPVILALSLVKPRRALAYEPHRRSQSGLGRRLQNWAVRRAGNIFPITPQLAADLAADGGETSRIHLAHDGIRRGRFEHVPEQAEARKLVGWPEDAFIVGYVGRLHTMSMDKGVGVLVEALGGMTGAALALVGGPDDMAEALRRRWLEMGLPEAHFLYAGHVPPERVPLYLSAFDVCAMPHPYTKQFAQYTSPLKLFEYMAAGRALVASDLPGWADVIQDGESALLVPPGDAAALRAAITRLREDTALRDRLAAAAYRRVMAAYTWEARARMILEKLKT